MFVDDDDDPVFINTVAEAQRRSGQGINLESCCCCAFPEELTDGVGARPRLQIFANSLNQ
jgi:hypothetical protein